MKLSKDLVAASATIMVLRILTNDSAAATGTTTALQFLPALLLSAHAGLVADRVDQRRFLVATQSVMGVVSAVLAADVLGLVALRAETRRERPSRPD